MRLMKLFGTGLLGLGLFAGGCYAGNDSGYKRGVEEGIRMVEEMKGNIEIALRDYSLDLLRGVEEGRRRICEEIGVPYRRLEETIASE